MLYSYTVYTQHNIHSYTFIFRTLTLLVQIFLYFFAWIVLTGITALLGLGTYTCYNICKICVHDQYHFTASQQWS